MACIFCDFISGKREIHEKSPISSEDYPLIPVYEDDLLFIFLSIPDNLGETHLLVIPKEHVEFLENLSENLSSDIIKKVQKAASIIRENYGDCHILLNNGWNADQYIPHVHFHIIPKTSDRKPLWYNLSVEEFIKISEELKEKFNKSSK